MSSTWAERPEWGPCPAGGVVSEDAPGTTITIPPVSDTSLIDPDVLANVLSAALAHGGDMAEVFAEDATTASAMLDDRRVEELSSGRSRGAGIRVVAGETTGFAHTSDLSEKGLLAAAAAAASVARDGGDKVRTVAMQLGPLAAHDRGDRTLPSSVAKSAKLELLVRADEAARAAGGSISQVQVGCGDSRRRVLIANSDGLLAEDDQVRTRFSVVVRGQRRHRDADRATSRWPAPRASRSSSVTTSRTSPGRPPTAPWPSWPPARLRRARCRSCWPAAAGASSSTRPAATVSRPTTSSRTPRCTRGKIGQLVASPLVTLVDDGTVLGEWGNFAVDDEGRAPARNVLIENGVLTDYMWDWLRARKEGRASSGNGRRQTYQHLPMVRMTNTFLLAGTEDADEIVAQTPRGVYVAKLGGGQVNTTTGDFVFGTTEAYLIEDGQVTAPLRDANLIGNGPEVLRRIDAVADDFDMTPGTCGKDGQSVPVGCGQATLRITGVTLGGTA